MSTPVPSRVRPSLRQLLASVTATVLVASVLVISAASPVAAAPAPMVSLSVPESPFIGEQVEMSVTFSNTSPLDVGYGPYTDVFMPVTGADGTSGGGPNDGLSFVSATYLGAPVVNQTVTLACDGTDLHPLTGLVVDCPSGFRAGDTMTTITLPFGSFTSSQPAATVSITAQLSDFADLGHTLSVAASGGFRFGADPLDNPLVDPPIVSDPPVTAPLTPALITIDKHSNAPESETATGPNFARTWTVSVELAPGQTVTDLRLTDELPDAVFYQGVSGITPSGSVTDEPAPGVHAAEQVTVTYPSVNTAASFGIDFHVPELDAAGDPILGPLSGSDAEIRNDASALGDWTPLDPRDPAETDNAVADPAGPLDTVTARSVATQKSVSVSDDTGATGPTPGDTLTWNVEVQISDYFSFDDLHLADVAADGQHLDTSYPPTITLNTPDDSGIFELGSYFTYDTNGPGSPGGCAATDPGAITVGVDLGGFLEADAPPSGGTWVGNAAGGTTAQVTFKTVIDSDYRCEFGGSAVNTRDVIANRVEVSGTVATSGGGVATDTSAADVTIVAPTAAKTIYAINGNTSDTGPSIAAGDLVTYRIRATVPLTNVLGYDVTDYLPLPTFDIPSGPSPFTNLMGDGPQGPGPFTPVPWSVALGPSDTFSSATGDIASLSTDADGNSVTIDYPDYQAAPGTAGTVQDVLITVTANNQPFADGLLLTNQARLTSQNSPSETVSTDAIAQVVLTQPELAITKGVVAANRPSATFTPAQVGPAGVTWSAPGSAGTRFSGGPLNSTALASHAVDSNVAGLDGADTVTFAIVVENTGSGIRGAFDVAIADTILAGLSEPVGGWNLSVTDGNGTSLPFTGGSPASIVLTDPGPTLGALSAADPTSGTNVAVITFDATLDGSVELAEVLSNEAEVTNFSGSESGPNFVVSPIEDTATVRVATPAMTKGVVATAIAGVPTAPTSLELPIGSTATYRAVMTIPESTTSAFSVRDTLDAGLAFVSFDSITASPALTTSHAGGFAGVLSGATVSAQGAGATAPGRVATFDFGTLTNADTDNATAETIEITYTVVLLNASANTTGAARNNSIQARVAGANVGTAASANDVRVNEPALSVTKSASPPVADAGDTVTFTVVVTASAATRTITAHDVALTDTLPSGLEYVDGTFTHVSGAAPTTISDTGGDLSAQWTAMVPGATSTFNLQAVVSDDAASGGAAVTNSAALTWSSLVGPQGGSLSPYNTLGVQRTGSTSDVGGTANTYARSATASVTVNQSQVAKSLVSTSAPSTTGANVTIGETATFSLAVTVPDGNLGDVTVTDLLPAGLGYVAGSATLDPGSFAGTWTGSPALPNAQTSGNNVSFVFDDMAVASGPGTADNTFTINLTARVDDVGSNTAGATLANNARVTVAGTQFNSAPVELTVVVPNLVLTKAFSPSEAAANDTVTVTLGLTNDGTSTAFDATVSDLLDGDVFTDVTPVAPSGWSATAAPSGDDTLVTYTADPGTVLAPTASQSFTFTAKLASDVTAPSTQSNTANASASTLEGASDHERTVTATGSDTLEVTGVDIAVTKVADVTSADAGDRITYTITVENVGGRDADGVVLTDTLGDDVTFVSAGGSYSISGSVLTWDPFDLAAGASTTRTVVVDVDNPLPMDASSTVNTAEAHDDGSHGDDLDPSNNDGTATVLLGSVVDLAVDKSGPTTATAGGSITYTVIVSSLGDRDALDATVTDTLGADLMFVSASGGGVYDPLTRTITWTGVDLSGNSGANPSVTFTVAATIADPLAAGHLEVVNDAEVDHPDDVNPSNDTDSVTTTVDAVVDLAVTKDNGRSRVVPGEASTYEVSVTNTGTRGASGVTVTDTLDPNLVFVSSTGGGAYDPVTHTVSWTLGTVEVGDVVDLQVAVTVADPLDPASSTSITNTVVVTDDGVNGPEADPSDNTATDTDVTGADLVVTKALDGKSLVPGAKATFRITVRNDGPMTVKDLSVNDTMPTQFNLDVVSVDRGAIDADTWLWSDVNLAPGETATMGVVVEVSLDATGTLTNTVTITGVGVGDPTPSNNTSAVTNPVVPEVNLQLDKTLNGTLARGSDATWTLVVTNNGPSRATNVVVVDTLPTGLGFAGATGTDGTKWTCTNPDPATVSCALAATMEPSDTATLVITTSVATNAPSGRIVNHARVSAAETEMTVADNGTTAEGVLSAAQEHQAPSTTTPPTSAPTSATTPTTNPPTTQAPSGPRALGRTGTNPQALLVLGAVLLTLGVALSLRRRSSGSDA